MRVIFLAWRPYRNPTERKRNPARHLLERSVASVRIPSPQANIASACGHSTSSPTPLRKIPRRMTKK